MSCLPLPDLFNFTRAAECCPRRFTAVTPRHRLRCLLFHPWAAACSAVWSPLDFVVDSVYAPMPKTIKTDVSLSNKSSAILSKCGILPRAKKAAIRLRLALRLIAALLIVSFPGSAETFSGAFSRASDLQKAGRLSDARAALQNLLRDSTLRPAEKASASMELSRIDLTEGRYADAVGEGGRAIAGFRAAGDRANEGYALTITGLAHTYAGEYDAALHDSAAALKLARDARDRAGEITRLNNIGNVFYFEGRYADALEQYESAMRIVKANPSESWSAARRQLTVANLASLYQRLGQYGRALDAYSGLHASRAALKIEEQAQLLANMGALYRHLGDPVKALETYRAAQNLYRQQQMRTGEIAILINIGIAQALDLAQLPDALTTFDQALKMAETSGDLRAAVQAQLYRAETLFRMRRIPDAEKYFAQAASHADSLQAHEEQWKALYGLARIADREGNAARETSLLRHAVRLIESLRGSGPGDLRSGFLADKRQVYDLLIARLAQAANPNAADIFRLMELSRARTLQDRTSNNVALDATSRNLPAGTLLLEYWIGQDAVAIVWSYRPRLRCQLPASGIGFSGTPANLREHAGRSPQQSMARRCAVSRGRLVGHPGSRGRNHSQADRYSGSRGVSDSLRDSASAIAACRPFDGCLHGFLSAVRFTIAAQGSGPDCGPLLEADPPGVCRSRTRRRQNIVQRSEGPIRSAPRGVS